MSLTSPIFPLSSRGRFFREWGDSFWREENLNFKMKVGATLLVVGCPLMVWAGPFAPSAGEEGSTAVALDDASVVGWATTVVDYQPDASVDEAWTDSSNALGPAEGNSFQVCSLGPGGTLTVSFGRTFSDGPGPDLAVFENSFSRTFLELAFVEVSSDGVNFFRFPNRSLTPQPVGSMGAVDATDIDGLASKYVQGFGTPFDLSDLQPSPLLDLEKVSHVRLVDVIGGTSVDSEGSVIYDPFPTTGSAGFDCDAIALLERAEIEILACGVEGEDFRLRWEAEIGEEYFVMGSTSLEEWSEVASLEAEEEEEEVLVAIGAERFRFFRVETR